MRNDIEFKTDPRRQLQITTDDNYKCTFYIATPPYKATGRGRELTEGARRASGVHSLPRLHSTTHHLSPLIFLYNLLNSQASSKVTVIELF